MKHNLFLRSVFKLSKSTLPKKRCISKGMERKIVSIVGKNNIHFSVGRYLTESDIDEMRRQAFKD